MIAKVTSITEWNTNGVMVQLRISEPTDKTAGDGRGDISLRYTEEEVKAGKVDGYTIGKQITFTL